MRLPTVASHQRGMTASRVTGAGVTTSFLAMFNRWIILFPFNSMGFL